jgi:signal transduction histidine kinase
MKAGIRRRLVWSYLLLIILTVVLFEILIVSALRFYYVEGIKQAMKDQGAMFTSFYEQEMAEGTFSKKAPILLQRYNFLINAQVQIYDSTGKLIADTHETLNEEKMEYEDVGKALGGETSYFQGETGEEKILSISQPLNLDETTFGAIRVITSMKQVDQVLQQNSLMLMLIGLFVILVAAFISLILANTITKPIGVMTAAAEQMASGQFSVRIAKTKNDEIGKLAETLNYMAEEVEKHEQLKNEFIASVSHELRTPLTSVKGWAITLHSMSEDQVFREGLEIISNESERLSHMLGDLLDLSRLSAGKIEYKFEKIDIESLIHQAVSQMAPRAARQGVKLTESISGSGSVQGDVHRLKQVLLNILDNSLKFTQAGGKVTVSLQVSDKDVLVAIADSGAGIPDEELPLVKEKFFKGKSRASGTGLGLAICQEIIAAHNGSLDLKSKASKGTTVEIRLPVDKS